MTEMNSWEDWQQALAKRYLDIEPADQPLIFFVDAYELHAIAGEDGRKLLTCCVRRELQETGSPYDRILERARGWAAEDVEPPPTLPLLAVTVLAATAMESADGVSVLDYYTRLRDELVPGGGSQWRSRLGDNFAEVAKAWLELHSWITLQGRRSTIVENPHPPYIGYPLSQALIRRADQNALTRFWKDAGLEPGGDQPDGSELLKALRGWVRPSRGFSAAFMKTVDKLSGAEQKLLEELLHRAACTWDGVVRSRAGSVIPRCRLSAWQANHVARLEWLVGPGDTLENVDRLSFAQGHLPNGLADSDGTQLHDEASVIVLRFDQMLQCWIEVPDFRLNQEHAVVWDSASWREAAEDFVLSSDNGSSGMIRMVEGASGTRAVFGIYFSSKDKLGEALKKAALRGLSFESQRKPRLRLAGGLRISNSLGTRVYAVGGAPDLVLPTGDQGEMVEVALDGEITALPRSGLSFPLLQFQTHLEAASHRLEADGAAIHFEIASEPEDLLGRLEQPTVGYEISGSVIAQDGSLQLIGSQMRGGAIAIDPAAPVVTQREAFAIAKRGMTTTYLMGPSGAVRLIEEPAQPAVWADFGDCPQAATFNVGLYPYELWMVQVKNPRVEIHKVGGQSQAVSPASAGSTNHDLWDQVVGLVNEADPPTEWREFVEDQETLE